LASDFSSRTSISRAMRGLKQNRCGWHTTGDAQRCDPIKPLSLALQRCNCYRPRWPSGGGTF
jgi:hypothetical protein